MSDFARLQLFAHLAILVGELPWLLVMLAGGVVCLRRLSTRPREGWLVGAAIALSLFTLLGVSNAITLLLQFMPALIAPVTSGTDSGWKYQLLYGLPISIAQAGACGLILYAAFGEGSGPRSKYLVEDETSSKQR